ncbi:major facilitator superfamily domain-containing protein 4A isoform X2 [Peromyscus californicus insignis]|uniref:major facilitator superfamily domain-containing protein 4A isoform X2 n=1 Tax=Peromyscus californicus insignis TaxID=564181 RepID=UPI0022A772D6|nr:major facilitator superfamily domain-containing protein 4A isoform X2 [Peromyscus californicus insignis]
MRIQVAKRKRLPCRARGAFGTRAGGSCSSVGSSPGGPRGREVRRGCPRGGTRASTAPPTARRPRAGRGRGSCAALPSSSLLLLLLLPPGLRSTGALGPGRAASCRPSHGLRRPGVGAAPPQPAAHAHLLERLLQLRPVHRLPGAHAVGPALPNAQLAAPDLLGLLLAAALPPAGQRPRGRLQEDVLHFFVGFGALLSPLIADPFLSEANCFPANSTANASSRSHLFHASRVLGQHQAATQPWSNQTIPGPSPKDSTENHVSYAFWIMALINLPVPLAVLFLLSKERLLTCPQRTPLLLSADELALETRPAEKEDTSSLAPKFQSHPGQEDLFSCCQRKNFRGAPCSFFAIHITAALVLFMTDGMMGAYSAFVYSYAVEKPLSVGHKMAGYLPSLFWGFITLGRLISIPVSSRMRPATMVFINVVGVVVTFLLLLIFSYNVIFLFVGTASLGLFLSSTFPSMLAYTEDILQYKGCATTVLVTGAGIGEMVLQMLVGLIFQAQGSYSFLVCGVIFGCLAFIFYTVLLFFHRIHPELSSVLTQDKPLGVENSESYQR